MERENKERKENKSVRFQMLLTPSEAQKISEFRWEHRIKSEAEALRVLMEKGFKVISDERKTA